MAKKRLYARENNLCITCCKAIPQLGRSVCSPCSSEASQRKIRRRLASQQHTELQQVTGESAKTVEMLLQRAQQLLRDARIEAALPLIAQAIEIADADANQRLRAVANGRMADYLMELSRYREAETFLQAVGEVDANDDATVRATFYTQRGALAATSGNASEAFDYFERAVSAAKEGIGANHVTSVWAVQGFWAMELGRIELAKSCYEQALLVARKYNIVWRIPQKCLEYAQLLFLIGQHRAADEYLLHALAYGENTPSIEALFAEVGIPLALYTNHEATLTKCSPLSAIDFAFRSGQSSLIGPVAAAFAELHVAQGHPREAQTLLHRAMNILHEMEQIPQVWPFPVTVARFGFHRDISKARRILEVRAMLPSSDLAQACLALFDAFVAQRNGRPPESHDRAQEAVERFMSLGWHHYADLARTLLPVERNVPLDTTREHIPFANMLSILTTRERQVAELALKGLTNRAIAHALSIRERTVETHMTSIMSRLGVRSRYQLLG